MNQQFSHLIRNGMQEKNLSLLFGVAKEICCSGSLQTSVDQPNDAKHLFVLNQSAPNNHERFLEIRKLRALLSASLTSEKIANFPEIRFNPKVLE